MGFFKAGDVFDLLQLLKGFSKSYSIMFMSIF